MLHIFGYCLAVALSLFKPNFVSVHIRSGKEKQLEVFQARTCICRTVFINSKLGVYKSIGKVGGFKVRNPASKSVFISRSPEIAGSIGNTSDGHSCSTWRNNSFVCCFSFTFRIPCKRLSLMDSNGRDTWKFSSNFLAPAVQIIEGRKWQITKDNSNSSFYF